MMSGMKTPTWRPAVAAAVPSFLLVVPLLLVNTAAVYGQQGWAYDHLGKDRPIAILFAVAVESIGIYLAAEAHAALMAGDASARLRMGSYLVGLLVGTLNYAHFAGKDYQVNPLALTFGLLSSISPMLWSIRSRSMNRDRLRELGQVDPRAVRFSILRWAMFPIRTAQAFRAAVWAGVVQPAEAVAAADAARAARPARRGRKAAAEIAVIPEPDDGLTVTNHHEAKAAPVRPTKATKTAQKVQAVARRNPDATPTVIAAKAGVSTDTARRYLRPAEPPVVAAAPIPEPVGAPV